MRQGGEGAAAAVADLEVSVSDGRAHVVHGRHRTANHTHTRQHSGWQQAVRVSKSVVRETDWLMLGGW